MLDMVFELASKKSWLREECGWIIHRLVKDCHLRPSTKELAETVIERLCAHKMALTPEGVAIWMTVQDLHVDVTLPKRPWQHQDPLHSSNLDQLAGVMRDAPMGENAATEESQSSPPSRGVWNARPNIAWMMVLDKYYQGERQRRPVKFSRFWTRAVDGRSFLRGAQEDGFLADTLQRICLQPPHPPNESIWASCSWHRGLKRRQATFFRSSSPGMLFDVWPITCPTRNDICIGRR